MTLLHGRILPSVVCALAAIVTKVARAQEDVVLFKNGDRLTGEIKSLDRGKVTFDNPATGIIKIEWDDIDRLESRQNFELALETGERLYGSLAADSASATIRLQSLDETLDLPLPTVVRMTPIEGAVLERIEMSVDLGYSFAKADELVQTNAGYDFRYRDEERQVRLNFDASTSDSANDPVSTRAFTNLELRRFREGRDWDPFGVAQLERNDELGIDKRVSLGGGMSRWLRDANDRRISFGGGLVYTSEEETDGTTSATDAEAMITMDFEWFRYDEPELDVTSQLTLFRRLSGGEERGNLDLSFRWEIFKDFFWGLSVYYSFDERQTDPDDEEETSDYGAFTSLGWKF